MPGDGPSSCAIIDYANYRFIREAAAALAKRDRMVRYLYSPDFASPNRGEAQRPREHEVPIATGVAFHKDNLVRRLAYEVDWGVHCAQFLKDADIEHAVLTNAPLPVQQALALWRRRTGKRLTLWIQDIHSIAIAETLSLPRWPRRALLALLSRWEGSLLNAADAVVAISSSHAKRLEQLSDQHVDISVLPNWAWIEDFPGTPKSNPWSRTHGLEHGTNVMYTGTLGRKHAIEPLLVTAHHLVRTFDAKLVILSEGPSAHELQRRASEDGLRNLVVLPYVANDYFHMALASADILTLLLSPEASQFSVPSKTWAYMCAGRPIVAYISAQNQAAQTIINSGSGIVVDCTVSGPEAYAEAIASLVQDRKLRCDMSKRSRHFAENNYGPETVIDSLESTMFDGS